jgi:Uma2 family endonuclease
MATSTTGMMVPLAEYLETTYRPDCDWIDGVRIERNMGEKPHNRVQQFLCQFLGNHEREWNIAVYPEQRVQTSQKNYRVADVCVTERGAAEDQDALIVTTPPVLCVEILSRNDGLIDRQDRVDDYKGMGVRQVWIVDPFRRRAYMANEPGFLKPEADVLIVAGTPIRVALPEMFAALETKSFL